MPSKNVKKTKGANVAPPPKKIKPESSDEDDDDSSEEETIAKKPVTQTKAAKNAQPAKKAADSDDDDSDDDDSDDEVPAPKVVAPVKSTKNAAAKKAAATKKEESDDDDDDDDSSDEEVPAPKVKAAKNNVAAKKAESDDDDDDDDSSDEETAKKTPVTKAATKKAEESSDDDDDDDDDEEDKAPATKKMDTAAKKEDSDDDDDDDEEDDDDDEEDTKKVNGTNKRKKGDVKTDSKKAKIDEISGTELFVKDLPDGVTDVAVVKFFKKKGAPVLSAKLVGKNMTCSFVVLNEEMTSSAVEKLNGLEMNGSTLVVELARKKDAGATPNRQNNAGPKDKEEENARTIFIKNLSYETEEGEVSAQFPNCTQVRLPRREDGKIKGFGFIEFASAGEADKAMEDNQGCEINGREIVIDRVGAKSSFGAGNKSFTPGSGGKFQQNTNPSSSLIIRNLSYDTTNESLQEAFDSSSGARVIFDRESGRSKGFGFIDFESVDEAKKILSSMNGQTVDGRQIRLEFSEPREKGGFGGGGGGGRGGGGRGGFRGRGGDRGGGYGGRGGGGFNRGGRGGGRGGRGGFNSEAQKKNKGMIDDFKGKKITFDD